MSASNKKSSAAKSRDPLQKPWQRQTKAKAAVSQSATVGVSSPKVAAKETAKAPRQEESKVYGENACRELFRQRPEAIIRLYINSELAPRFADLMKYLAQQKRAYHLVDDTELEKVAGSQHHGGIVLLVKRKPMALTSGGLVLCMRGGEVAGTEAIKTMATDDRARLPMCEAARYQ